MRVADARLMVESWMLARLRRETANCHATADADRTSVMTESVSAADYAAFLTMIYGFEAPVTAALGMTPDLDTWFDMRGRGELRLLRADLNVLGILDASVLPRCRGIAPFASPADALGWLYVLERNALVHDLVERHLLQRIPAVIKPAGSYLAAHRRTPGLRWRELGDALDRYARTPRDADQIVAAAHVAFRCQHDWYQDVPVEHVAQRVA